MAKRKHRKKTQKATFKMYATLIALAIGAVLTCCREDLPEPAPGGTTGGNTEKPGTSVTNINANNASKDQSMARWELPKIAGGNTLVLKKDTKKYGMTYIIEWDCDKKAQRWTAWEWNEQNSVKGWNRSDWKGATWQGKTWSGDPFQEDPDIPEQYRSLLSDYKYSGYDRGHICASEDRICDMDVNGQTFYLSNMHPQVNGFNARVWSNMESQLRKWNDASIRDVMWVCKGGTIGDVHMNGEDQTGLIEDQKMKIPVPKYFFMAVVVKKDDVYKGMAFWVEHASNSDKALAKYVISIDELEKRTGIDFFCNMPDNIENSVEKMLSPVSWGLQ